MDENLKVSFYLKREKKNERNNNAGAVYPVVGKIIVGKTIAQFGSKLKVNEKLWNVKSGRATGKSKIATELNKEINKINLSIHSHYSEILKRTGKVTAQEIKKAFQGIASAQKTVLGLFGDMLNEFHSRVGIDRSASTYLGYQKAYHHLKRFITEKYRVRDMPLSRLDLPFIEGFNFYLRVEHRMKPSSVCGNIVPLQQVVRMALRRNLLSRFPFAGYNNPVETLSHSFVCKPVWLKPYRRRYKRADTDAHYSNECDVSLKGVRMVPASYFSIKLINSFY